MALTWTPTLAALALTVAAPAASFQEERSETVVIVCPEDGDRCSFDHFAQRRGRLGVLVNTRRNPETDSVGALIHGVIPGGPADKAGLEKGDVITRFNGERLTATRGEADEDESAPGLRLIELASELEPGDTVRLEYRRDRQTRTATLVAGRHSRIAFRRGPHGWPDFDFDLDLDLDVLPRLRWLRELPRHTPAAMHLGRRLHGLELAALNPDLGAYFGASEGVLVIDVPKDSPLGLKAGDVILSVDGRKPSSPEHARRILRSYETDEEVRFEILRQRKKRRVQGKIPEHTGFRWRPRERPDPPEPK